MPRSAPGRAVRDPVLLGLAVGTAVLVAGYLAGVGDQADRVRTLWAAQPVLDALLAWVTWRIARSGSTPAPARRFFHAFTVAGCSFALGDGYQTLKRALPRLPADRLVLETNSPDHATGKHGSSVRNEPSALVEVARALGEILGEPRETLL